MSLDQILMIPGYSGSSGGGGADFNLSANNLTAGTPVLGTPTLTLNVPSETYLPTFTTATQLPAYSLVRQMRAAYAGDSFLARRSSDNATLDFGPLGTKSAPTAEAASLVSWAAGSDVFVETLYDQSTHGTDFTQATDSLQPMICESGAIIYDDDYDEYPCMSFDLSGNGRYMTATHGSSLAPNNLSVTGIYRWSDKQVPDNDPQPTLFTLGSLSNGFSLQFGDDQSVISVDGNSYAKFESDNTWVSLTPCAWHTMLFTATATSSEAGLWKNNTRMTKELHSATGTSSTALYLGHNPSDASRFSAGKCSELILTTALDDTDHTALYETINAYYSIGPTTEHEIPGYQVEPWQQTLWEWMETIVEADVGTPLASVSWDGTYGNNTQLANIWLQAENQSDDSSLRADAKHFILDDGNGLGIYPPQEKRLKCWKDGGQTGSCANILARLYRLDLPQSGGGQGNPFYQHSGIGARALMSAASNLIQGERDALESPTVRSLADSVGGFGFGALGAFWECRGEVPQAVQDAFYDAAIWYAKRSRHYGPRHDNANMDAKLLPLLTVAWQLADAKADTAAKNICVEAAKRNLFGSTTGTLATTTFVRYEGGIMSTCGLSREAGTLETTYCGQTFKELALAYSYVNGEADWAFLLDCIDAYNEATELQTLDDITTLTQDAFNGPSGYSGRTTGSLWRDQGQEQWRHAIMGSVGTKGAWTFRHRLTLPATGTLVTEAQSRITSNLADTDVALAAAVSGTAACHTDGYDWSGHDFTIDIATDELVFASHSLQVGDALCPYLIHGSFAEYVNNQPFTSTRFFYVVAVNSNRVQVSETLGGAAINFDKEPKIPSYTAYKCAWIYHFTDSPDLTYSSSTNTSHALQVGGKSWSIIESDDTNDMVAVIADDAVATSIALGAAVDYSIEPCSDPGTGQDLVWPPLPTAIPASGWYDTYKALVDGSDSSTFLRTEASGETYSVSLGDEFWCYKNASAGGREFMWVVSASEYPGAYSGAYTGSLEAFGTDDTGIIILSRRFDEPSVDGDFSQVETWPHQHTWGLDDSGTPTAFATKRGRAPNGSRTFNLGDATPNVVSSRSIGDGVSDVGNQEAGVEITGEFTEAYTFAVNSSGDGILTTVTLSSDQADSVTALWHSIPIYLRAASQSMSDAVIQYWDGSTWTAVGASLVSADWVRIGRDHGGGTEYVWINFSSTEQIKLSSAVRESSSGDARTRQLMINAHSTTPGSSALLPSVGSPKVIEYDITVTDPGLTPTNPSLAFTEPAAATTYFVGGLWWAAGTCEFYGTGGSVDLEYSTDSTDGSDGTWNTVATMTNTSGTNYAYQGDDVAIPSGLTYIRMNASDSAGSSTLARAVSSTAKTLVLDDPFTGTNGTVIDGTWSGWTTNTTSNVYTQPDGQLEIDTNQIKTSVQANNTSTIAIDVGATNVISEAEVVPNTSSSGVDPRLSVWASMTDYNSGLRLAYDGGSSGFAIWENANKRVVIPGTVTTSSTYRLTLQVIGTSIVAKVYDVTGASLFGSAVYHGVVITKNNNCGVGAMSSDHRVDSFKVWT